MRCSPTFYSHPKASTVLSFLLLSPPPPYQVFSYLVFTSQEEHSPIIPTRPPNPTLSGVPLPCIHIPRGAQSYHSHKTPQPHPIRCSPTLYLNPKGSTVLSFPLDSQPHPIRCSPTLYSHPKGRTVLSFPLDPSTPPYQVFSYLVFTSQGEHCPIIPTRPPNPTISGVLLPCIHIPRGALSYHSH